MSLILACDLGGTSLRAGLVDANGVIRHQVALAGPVVVEPADGLESGEPESGGSDAGGSETDITDWWDRLCAALDQLAEISGAAFDTVAAVAITGVTRTQILVDRDGSPLRPAITWGDSRADTLIAELRLALPAGHPEIAALNAFHPIARLYWLQRHQPSVLPAAAAVLDPKDYFNFRLTGRLATDRISSARLIAAAEQPAVSGQPGKGPSLFDALGIDPAIVPDTLEPTSVVGEVVAGLPGALSRLSGRPVMAMAHDTWASVLGLGALRDGYAYNLSGTTEVFGVLSRQQAFADGLLSVDWGEQIDRLHQLGGPSQNGADTLVWALELLSRSPVDPKKVGAGLETLLAEPRHPQPLIFLPYLQGERTPYWNASLRGAFVGLSRHHRAVDCVHAVLEGVAFLNRIVLQRAETANGCEVTEIRFGGGGAANATWCQIKADICERTVVVTDCPEPGLLGAAIVAWAALGEVSSIEQGQEAMVAVARRHQPRTDMRDGYRRLFGLYRQTEEALVPISSALTDWGGGDGA